MQKISIYKSEKGKIKIHSFYETLLANWIHPNQHKKVQTSYGETFILCSGPANGQPVILLHGSGSNSAMWMSEAKILSENYRVYAIDIIGECGKSSESRPDWKSNHYAKWLNELFEQLNISSASLIACSLGGWIAIDYASRFPLKVDKLVLLATAGITPVKVSTLLLIIITSFMGSWGFRKINKRVYGNLKIDETTAAFANLIKQYYVPRTDVLPLFDDEKLQKLKAPVLFIGGENDCFYDSQKTANRLKDNLQSIETKVLKNTGHVLMNTINYIIEFLNRW